MLYKVVKKEGVEIDGVGFIEGELFEIEEDKFNVAKLLAEGSIEEVSEEDIDTDEELPPSEGTHQPEEVV